ncbi:hypothetical protein [Staphylococcus phage vB_SauM-V1SA22]|nr:hypothetical protein [Staphylococcus phage vB_SauM-V1SA22]UVT34757.1 hypothetical protein [Staphylococcus phage vB_SauM-V1SA20]
MSTLNYRFIRVTIVDNLNLPTTTLGFPIFIKGLDYIIALSFG